VKREAARPSPRTGQPLEGNGLIDKRNLLENSCLKEGKKGGVDAVPFVSVSSFPLSICIYAFGGEKVAGWSGNQPMKETA
jgi:hypothetical protein